jgi:glycosyltransferase involved in cell wall biosynthesis
VDALIPSDESKKLPRFDVVLQATGNHAHAASHGIVNSLARLGLLGRVFQPRAEWGQCEPKDDDGLYDYLTAPDSEFMLFLGFDWHSQPLHSSLRWRNRIRMAPCVKVGYMHETFRNGTESEQRAQVSAFLSCHSLIDIIWHASPDEAEYIEKLISSSRPVVTSDFAVDTGFFSVRRLSSERPGFAFFRGKLKPFTHPSQYQERRDLVEYLAGRGLIDVKSYNPLRFSDAQLVDEYNDYRICIDPPSVFAGPTTRVFEAIACGCIVFSHARNFSEIDVQKLAPLLRTYNSKEDLADQLKLLREDMSGITYDQSRLSEVHRHISLDEQLQGLISRWIKTLPRVKLNAPVIRIFDHPYHAVTKSQRFLFDQFSDLNTILVNCDNAKRSFLAYESPTFQRGCYAELGWQTIHIYPHFDKPERRKRVLFPMFDGSNHWPDDSFPSHASYVCFSRTLHERLQRLGRHTRWVRYFPKSGITQAEIDQRIVRTEQRRATGSLKAYFWQRTAEITFSTAVSICRQLGCSELVVNLHHDPGQTALSVVQDGIVDGITISTHTWYERRSDALAIIDDCDIYIAPRSCEGIGMGFLEAMARGLCVVAYNAPTMNEYITDGVNGLLYSDIRNPNVTADVNIVEIRRRVASEAIGLADTWESQLQEIKHQYHPFSYSSPLRWLRHRGVTFRKLFDFKIEL